MVACCRRSRGRLRELSLAPGGGAPPPGQRGRVSLLLSQKKRQNIWVYLWGVLECPDISKFQSDFLDLLLL